MHVNKDRIVAWQALPQSIPHLNPASLIYILNMQYLYEPTVSTPAEQLLFPNTGSELQNTVCPTQKLYVS